MRAAIVRTAGVPPTLGEHRDPEPAQGETLVRVTAAPIVPLDLLCASGTSYFGMPATPYVPGVQGVGIVDSSSTFGSGTRVWFATSAGMAAGDGSLAELCAVPDGDVVALEDQVPDPVVASLGLSAVAAWRALTAKARLSRGERVVVLGAGGAVGQAAVGAARVLGASRVVAVCRPGSSALRAQHAGADEVVTVEEDTERLAAQIERAVGGAADVVVDPVFGTSAAAACRVLAHGGRLVNIGGASNDSAEFSSSVIRSRSLEVLGYTNTALTSEQRAAALTEMLEHAARGAIKVEFDQLPLTRVEEGWQAVMRGDGPRVVVTVG